MPALLTWTLLLISLPSLYSQTCTELTTANVIIVEEPDPDGDYYVSHVEDTDEYVECAKGSSDKKRAVVKHLKKRAYEEKERERIRKEREQTSQMHSIISGGK